jgi:MFS family permease
MFSAAQDFYQQELFSSRSPEEIQFIGSVHQFLLLGVGALSGPVFDAGYSHILIFIGSIMTVFGIMMASLCSELWQIILSQGIVVGIGSGCLFVPSLALLTTYFEKKRSLAVGLALTGSSLGASRRFPV